MFRKLRIAVLLLILITVALGAWTDRIYSTRWNAPLRVALYPIAADDSPVTKNYVASITPERFAALEKFFAREAENYSIRLDAPIRVTLAPALQESPPPAPTDANVLQIMTWSLRLRWWAWWTPPPPPGPQARIEIFLLFHDPERSPTLQHSVGLQKGLLGVANLFAARSMEGSNQVVIAHELLHTLGATDKYDAHTQPIYPNGFAEPEREPRFPQRYAELMAGRVPDSPTTAHTPESLEEVLVGSATAAEIGWAKKK